MSDILRRHLGRHLVHHRHSGKLIEHHHTSYPALAFLLLLSTVLCGAVSMSSRAADSQLSLTVLGPPPSTAATIDEPANLDRFPVNSITVRGTCPLGLMVEIYRNGTFAGSTLCDGSGLYNIVITLVPGQNDLIARDLDGLGQYGPDSAQVTVYYDVPPPTPTPTPPPTPMPSPGTGTPPPTPTATPKPAVLPTPTPVAGPAQDQFYISSDAHYYQGADPSQPVKWNLKINGGASPYTITWLWGDGHQDTTTAQSVGTISASHQYSEAGIYHVTVRIRDAQGREATISLLAIVNGAVPGTASVRPIEPPGALVFIWPLLILASLLVGSFWLGERHKLAMTKAHTASG